MVDVFLFILNVLFCTKSKNFHTLIIINSFNLPRQSKFILRTFIWLSFPIRCFPRDKRYWYAIIDLFVFLIIKWIIIFCTKSNNLHIRVSFWSHELARDQWCSYPVASIRSVGTIVKCGPPGCNQIGGAGRDNFDRSAPLPIIRYPITDQVSRLINIPTLLFHRCTSNRSWS